MSQAPRYQHDCECCTFLGPFEKFDLYGCDDTVIARYGDQGDYVSGFMFASTHKALKEALARAHARGMYAHLE